jgi:acetolactate decarboxylase
MCGSSWIFSRFARITTAVATAATVGLGACAPRAVPGAERAGSVSYIGAQSEIFRTGRATAKISLRELSGISHLYALGPVEGFDGEITIFDSEPYVSQVRGADSAYVVDRTLDHAAFFLVWTRMREWEDVPVPLSVSSYAELQAFVEEAARERGIEAYSPFAFLMTGTPRELVWHINVDRTGGQPINQELFRQSKQRYTLRGERIDIFGVYSEAHQGIFTSPGLRTHLHFVSRESPATGHVDEISPGGLTLRLAAPVPTRP